jgi:hypothetical protein
MFGSDSGGGTVQGVGQQQLACRDCGLESRQGLGCPSIVNVACCQVVISATGRSLAQRSLIRVSFIHLFNFRRSYIQDMENVIFIILKVTKHTFKKINN